MPVYAGALRRSQFFAIVCAFWIYVTISDVLYAYSMRTGITRENFVPLFAPWDARVLQHVPAAALSLLVSFWASLRIQWRPLLLAIPLQILLGTCFAAIAYPAMMVATLALEGTEWHQQAMHHMAAGPFFDSNLLSLWLASFISFLPAYGFGLAMVTGLALYARFPELRASRRGARARVGVRHGWRRCGCSCRRTPLFNLLHTIRGYIDWDPKGAQSMVVQLADLLRRPVECRRTRFHPPDR